MHVKAYDVNKNKYLKKLKIFNKLNNLIKSSDAILVSVHLDSKTKNMINVNFLNKMKKNSILINTSRGEVINENHLLKALKNRKIKKVITDVLHNEQTMSIANNKMVQYSKENDNLIITPHMAGLTYESENIASEIIYKKLINEIN